jgi:hypothetical protein
MVIIAGYESELKDCFFSYNQGLDSRFTWRFKTENYKSEDLFQILLKKVKDAGWSVEEKTKINAEWFEKNMVYFKFFGRDIETLFSKIKIAHGRRIFCKPETDRKKITVADLEKGFEMFLKNDNVKNRKETETMNKKGDSDLQKKLTAAQEMLEQVQSELASMARRSLELERLPPLLSELEIKFKASEDAKIKNDFKVKEITEELGSYKALCEKLKQKIRDMSGKDSKTQDFLDSFEEVMRDEMMTMKLAFETKLKQAKEEADANSRRHQEEISRLSSGSPYLSLGLRKDSMGNIIRS